MTGLFSSWPYPLAVAMLFLIALARGNVTYWLGRAARAGARKTRARRLTESAGFDRASRLLNRWGPPVVSVSFLTVGFQTLINLAAGVSRMPLRRYLPAVGIGAVLWAFLYATVGFVAFAAWFKLYERFPALAVVALVVVAIGLVIFVLSQLRARRSTSQGDRPVDSTTL